MGSSLLRALKQLYREKFFFNKGTSYPGLATAAVVSDTVIQYFQLQRFEPTWSEILTMMGQTITSFEKNLTFLSETSWNAFNLANISMGRINQLILFKILCLNPVIWYLKISNKDPVPRAFLLALSHWVIRSCWFLDALCCLRKQILRFILQWQMAWLINVATTLMVSQSWQLVL